MTIEVLGTGCATAIMKYGVMSTPALVVNGQVKFAGKVPGVTELKGML